MEENERLAVLMDNAEHDVRHVTDLLDRSDKEKKRLSDRNAQLTINGMNSEPGQKSTPWARPT